MGFSWGQKSLVAPRSGHKALVDFQIASERSKGKEARMPFIKFTLYTLYFCCFLTFSICVLFIDLVPSSTDKLHCQFLYFFFWFSEFPIYIIISSSIISSSPFQLFYLIFLFLALLRWIGHLILCWKEMMGARTLVLNLKQNAKAFYHVSRFS